MNRETDPSGFWGAITALAGAVVAALVAFGVPLTGTQQDALLALMVAGAPVVTQLLIRRDAWSPVAHFREIRDVENMTAEDGDVDLGAVLTVLLIVLIVVVLVRVL